MTTGSAPRPPNHTLLTFSSSLLLSSLELSDTPSLWALNTSPPWNRSTSVTLRVIVEGRGGLEPVLVVRQGGGGCCLSVNIRRKSTVSVYNSYILVYSVYIHGDSLLCSVYTYRDSLLYSVYMYIYRRYTHTLIVYIYTMTRIVNPKASTPNRGTRGTRARALLPTRRGGGRMMSGPSALRGAQVTPQTLNPEP